MREFRTRARLLLDGYLGAVPELRYTPSAKAVLDLSVAVGGAKDRPGRWYKATFWDKDAEQIDQLGLDKGSAVSLAGNLVESDAWIGKDGKAKGKAKVGWIDTLKYEVDGELVEFELDGSKKKKAKSGELAPGITIEGEPEEEAVPA